MDRRLLTQRIRLLGIPIMLPAAALVLVAYGLPHPNPVPAQAVTTIKITELHGPDLGTCLVRPFKARVKTKAKQGQVKFRNQTMGTLLLFFPSGKLLWEFTPPPGAVAGKDNSLTYAILSHKDTTLKVSAAAMVGDEREYDAWGDTVGFCLGESHPDIIVW